MNVDARQALADLEVVLTASAPRYRRGDAALAAFWVLQAESLGLREFGIRMLAREFERLDGAGGIPAVPAAESDAPSSIGELDGTGMPGVVALAAAVRRASAATTSHGVGLVGVRGVGALGVLGLAARTLAAEGRVALIAAQAPAAVAPWGGRAPAVGTNPLAIALPRAGSMPLVVDYATSALTQAAVRGRAERGEALPHGSALGADGTETTDALAVAALLPDGLAGSLTGLLVELLAGAATGGRAPTGTPAATRGALVLAFDPAQAGGIGADRIAVSVGRDWTAAGGHLPARFDTLPVTADRLTGTLAVDDDSVAWLCARRDGSGRP